ncbi:arsenate reductase [Pelistega indica]|uniref:Arsenate reductase n=1 Tax=Pelistega indica TaxID=1414851 RepID=V8FYL7_9BURK|nr:arsenate reductase (glutaredoxin) [Pelistega indica]ETD68803.1 arsenate reductase [Pelistega indica]
MHNVKIYHNPSCGTSRNTLALIRAIGIEPEIIEYLKSPPNSKELAHLLTAMKMSPRELLRKNVAPYEELNLDNRHLTDDELVVLMTENPLLINRPIVVTEKGVLLCRPSERVLEILPLQLKQVFYKEDGEAVHPLGA